MKPSAKSMKPVVKAFANLLRKVKRVRCSMERQRKQLRATPHPIDQLARIDFMIDRNIGEQRGLRIAEDIIKQRIAKLTKGSDR